MISKTTSSGIVHHNDQGSKPLLSKMKKGQTNSKSKKGDPNHLYESSDDTLNLDKMKNSQELIHKGKRQASEIGLKTKSKEKNSKKIKLCEDLNQNIKMVKPTNQNMSSSNECRDRISSVSPSTDKPSLLKTSKRKKKKNKIPKSIGDGSELNLACLAYLNEWKNNKESWKFEKIKQIRLTLNMFDKAKLPNEYFDVCLEYMENASCNMKKLLKTRASEVIFNVEKWNNLSDKEKLTSPKPSNYEGYERARDLLQRFE